MLVWGRVVNHRSCRLAKSVRPYVAGENVGRVMRCALGVPSRGVEVKYVPGATGSSSRKVVSWVFVMESSVIMVCRCVGEVCIPCL